MTKTHEAIIRKFPCKTCGVLVGHSCTNTDGDVGRFAQEGSPYRYMLYPDDLFPCEHAGDPINQKPITFPIERKA